MLIRCAWTVGFAVASHAEAWIEITLQPYWFSPVPVASHAEAWIEMPFRFMRRGIAWCCLSCRGVNWNIVPQQPVCDVFRCLSCRGVNWNRKSSQAAAQVIRCLSCRGVNWNAYHLAIILLPLLLPLMQRRELKFRCFRESPVNNRCLSCRGVNWNNHSAQPCSQSGRLPLMQRRELKY